MHRFAGLVSIVVVLGALIGAGSWREVRAQEATPAGQIVAEGVSFLPLAVAPGVSLPASPATVLLTRYRLEPGSSQTTDAADPSIALISQETGTATARMEAPVVVIRGATGAPEEILANTDFTLEPGDAFAWLPGVAGEVRNEGTEPITALVVVIVPEAAATPTP